MLILFCLINLSFPNQYCGTYKQVAYWANNFNDFYVRNILSKIIMGKSFVNFVFFLKKSSLIVLWDIMVVNNWQITIEAFADATNEWSRFYFIFWWLICPVITLNMCVSLILDVSFEKRLFL